MRCRRYRHRCARVRQLQIRTLFERCETPAPIRQPEVHQGETPSPPKRHGRCRAPPLNLAHWVSRWHPAREQQHQWQPPPGEEPQPVAAVVQTDRPPPKLEREQLSKGCGTSRASLRKPVVTLPTLTDAIGRHGIAYPPSSPSLCCCWARGLPGFQQLTPPQSAGRLVAQQRHCDTALRAGGWRKLSGRPFTALTANKQRDGFAKLARGSAAAAACLGRHRGQRRT